jgi:hypothetical protein
MLRSSSSPAPRQAPPDEGEEEDEAKEEVPQFGPGSSISLLFYVANEDGSALEFDPAAAAAALVGDRSAPAVSGVAQRINAWSLFARTGGPSAAAGSDAGASPARDQLSVNYLALRTPHLHNLTDAVRQALHASVYQQHQEG